MDLGVLALDIGGANLKAAHSAGVACSRPFALWREPARLEQELARLVALMPAFDRLAVTMTAELCDCFASKQEGVRHVLGVVERLSPSRPVQVWTNEGRFVSIQEAWRAPLKTAAANWFALACFAGRLCPHGPALLVDIGSTTADVVPLFDGVPVPRGRTDLERLAASELVYMGIARTPICALLAAVHWRGQSLRPAAELFATTLDAYLLLGDLAECEEDRNTADGRPATRPHAHQRMARMLCADGDQVTEDEMLAVARQVRAAQTRLLAEAVSRVGGRLPGPPRATVLAGAGEFLARQVLAEGEGEILSVRERLGEEVSRAACAHALAVLALEGVGR